jgi:hypothetical protein
MSKASWAMAKRAEGAHINGIETLPLFYGAVVSEARSRDTLFKRKRGK